LFTITARGGFMDIHQKSRRIIAKQGLLRDLNEDHDSDLYTKALLHVMDCEGCQRQMQTKDAQEVSEAKPEPDYHSFSSLYPRIATSLGISIEELSVRMILGRLQIHAALTTLYRSHRRCCYIRVDLKGCVDKPTLGEVIIRFQRALAAHQKSEEARCHIA
jgi:hypothetical protein